MCGLFSKNIFIFLVCVFNDPSTASGLFKYIKTEIFEIDKYEFKKYL